MANTSIFLDTPMSDEERRRRLFRGDIFAHDPREIHRHSTAKETAAVLAKLKPQFIHHPDCKRLIPRIVAEHGVDCQKLYFDVPRIRSAYPSDFLTSGIAYAFHPHRDTWYSAPLCQLICKAGHYHDPACVIEPGAHVFLKRRSFVEYRHARIELASDLAARLKSGRSLPLAPVTARLLGASRTGVTKSAHIARKHRSFFG